MVHAMSLKQLQMANTSNVLTKAIFYFNVELLMQENIKQYFIHRRHVCNSAIPLKYIYPAVVM